MCGRLSMTSATGRRGHTSGKVVNRMAELIIKKSNDGTLLPVGELIRCKDCIYWDKGHTEECCNSDSVCFHNGLCEQNWFCADGERA